MFVSTTTGLCRLCGHDYKAHKKDDKNKEGYAFDHKIGRMCPGFLNEEMHEANRSAYYNKKPQGGDDVGVLTSS